MNRQGKVRLVKWFNQYSDEEKYRLNLDIYRLISSREYKQHSNFVEFQNSKLVYKRYAGLFFIAGIDLDDDELIHLSTIHLFVEILDLYFENVCELDVVFNFYKAYAILDEMFAAGEIQETSKTAILDRIRQINAME
ncbi:hypothetical protein WICMUC_001538 [Wickerhamomyces mucosus]|uniref:AP complex subunit sigma n=1 Tax=Wickerhamomyces mucosus TaxID=1378264 RepID=A0A9P8PUF7_9ASCO|nr:hypothetical protein WICMUC_001538 [Wickerhamomyces mucosus]